MQFKRYWPWSRVTDTPSLTSQALALPTRQWSTPNFRCTFEAFEDYPVLSVRKCYLGVSLSWRHTCNALISLPASVRGSVCSRSCFRFELICILHPVTFKIFFFFACYFKVSLLSLRVRLNSILRDSCRILDEADIATMSENSLFAS